MSSLCTQTVLQQRKIETNHSWFHKTFAKAPVKSLPTCSQLQTFLLDKRRCEGTREETNSAAQETRKLWSSRVCPEHVEMPRQREVHAHHSCHPARQGRRSWDRITP